MKKLFLLQIFVASTMVIFGQAGKLKLVVYDSSTNTSLEFATVSLLNKDSSLLTYQLTDKNGTVFFDKLPLKNKVQINISYVGYNTYSSLLQLTGKESLEG